MSNFLSISEYESRAQYANVQADSLLPPPPTPNPPHHQAEASTPSATMQPPPPPPPPPLPVRLSRNSIPKSSIPVPFGAFRFDDNIRSLQTVQDASVIIPSISFKPCHMFFYGSLMDSEVLGAVLKLSETPITRPATVSGFSIRMWGIYPALIPSVPGKVLGTVWKIDSEAHFERLQAYETGAYKWLECDATLENGEVLKDCRTFCWAGDSNSKELEDGSFDLRRYQKYFKGSVTRERSTEV
ncbi:hypothetical protein BKA66DRAFT_586123 [Pyrenochaeta sp. MPI-SDFR-AT-0127]|nr:hypothetical protein BKA66DRAFT_586123 [Pyrenochaeta sp. MPI-SDFR-AT-0127]